MTRLELEYEDDDGFAIEPWVLYLAHDLAIRLEWWLATQSGVEC